MKKRMLALALCAALLVGASACSQTEADSSSQVSTPSVLPRTASSPSQGLVPDRPAGGLWPPVNLSA